MIDDGSVLVDGRSGAKAATLVAPETPVVLVDARPSWASRGGEKLAGALDAFGIDVEGARALDVGASTGGFTDVLLSRGTGSVTAVDVGYGQLLWRLAQDDRVSVVDRTNFRTLDVAAIDPPFDIVVVDVSFISVTLLASQLRAAGRVGTGYVVLVKPQFEAGKGKVGPGGIVGDPGVRLGAVEAVADALEAQGLGAVALIESPITGTKGNVEYLLHAVYGSDRTLGQDQIAGIVLG